MFELTGLFNLPPHLGLPRPLFVTAVRQKCGEATDEMYLTCRNVVSPYFTCLLSAGFRSHRGRGVMCTYIRACVIGSHTPTYPHTPTHSWGKGPQAAMESRWYYLTRNTLRCVRQAWNYISLNVFYCSFFFGVRKGCWGKCNYFPQRHGSSRTIAVSSRKTIFLNSLWKEDYDLSRLVCVLATVGKGTHLQPVYTILTDCLFTEEIP